MPKKGPQKGSYAKGIAKREEILTTALDVFAQKGYRGASLREIASSVGLSQAGLLHHFSSKEELFAEVLRKRDEVDEHAHPEGGSVRGFDTLVDIVRHNADVPGLVQLYATISAEAADEDHPGHAYFVERYAMLIRAIEEHVRAEQSADRIDPSLDPLQVARLAIAVADGMQVQWMLDDSADMAATLEYFFTLIRREPRDARTATP
ncbi:MULTISPECIES: TetR/AcrR family transcriptional regulator [unclassified Leifsonia]|uniref:TetR/AcrR family transcriptional regulator n=1 Tax=unclassified Leifsonia TaxID=2663824 RepID=UPI000A1905FF|nr:MULTISPECIES: TetR/AcrR family transcriptional regulator [unclassified Leifsonia]QIZ98688.1 TetR/AcrR family transcriptional regulator [Leifsonia sp. PS1209]